MSDKTFLLEVPDHGVDMILYHLNDIYLFNHFQLSRPDPLLGFQVIEYRLDRQSGGPGSRWLNFLNTSALLVIGAPTVVPGVYIDRCRDRDDLDNLYAVPRSAFIFPFSDHFG